MDSYTDSCTKAPPRCLSAYRHETWSILLPKLQDGLGVSGKMEAGTGFGKTFDGVENAKVTRWCEGTSTADSQKIIPSCTYLLP